MRNRPLKDKTIDALKAELDNPFSEHKYNDVMSAIKYRVNQLRFTECAHINKEYDKHTNETYCKDCGRCM